jgi:DNA-binding NarL/FixJ family response regulator
VIGEAANGNDALELIEKMTPDVAVLDIDMPGLSGLDVARKLKGNNRKTRMVILTIHKDKEYFDEALELDIKAYILKESIANDLIDCIKQVAAGGYYISPSISGYLVQKNRESDRYENELDKLTPSEVQILKLIAQNKTSSQIADELFRSIRTIENHRNNICSKLGLKGPHALLLFAIQHKTKL